MPAVFIRTTAMQDLKRLLQRIGVAAVALLIIWYVGDYISLRMRRAPTSVVQITRFYAIPQKDGKTSFEPGEAATETCVNSMFPHMGYRPCWYVKRHRNQQINL
ncbi:MAG: hypothetical protein WCD12_04845 [Candidatus Binatus sp.]|uniref:hypothetical protein n=1 Tax=Candidatus Binatus sp. TaxID=2811406 RepID=UPI003C751D60